MVAARVQVDREELDTYLRSKAPEGGTYNIYHARTSGVERERKKTPTQAKYRCHPKKDAGDTAADRNPNAYFCRHFAKGECFKGARCHMWHRIPNDTDEPETMFDCFGREKHKDFKQDMSGVGGFSAGHHTLVASNIAKTTKNFDEAVKRHFSQFGTIDRIVYQPRKGCAFITYTSRYNAEFAKEAMMYQPLDNNEILDVRWADEKQSSLTQSEADIETDDEDDSDDDDNRDQRLKAQKPIKKTERRPKAKIVPDPRQEIEADLPAEYTKRKRDVNEGELESLAKHQQVDREDEAAEYQTPMPAIQTAAQTHEQAQAIAYQQYAAAAQAALAAQAVQSSQPKSTEVISRSLFASLDRLKASKKFKPKPASTASEKTSAATDPEKESAATAPKEPADTGSEKGKKGKKGRKGK